MRRLGFARSIGARAIALLLSSIVCVGASGFGHSAWDDLSCDPVPVQHDHNAHRFKSGHLPTRPADDHCLACHSLRSLRTGLVAIHAAVTDSAQVAAVRAVDVIPSSRVLDSNTPSRAPPASLL